MKMSATTVLVWLFCLWLSVLCLVFWRSHSLFGNTMMPWLWIWHNHSKCSLRWTQHMHQWTCFVLSGLNTECIKLWHCNSVGRDWDKNEEAGRRWEQATAIEAEPKSEETMQKESTSSMQHWQIFVLSTSPWQQHAAPGCQHWSLHCHSEGEVATVGCQPVELMRAFRIELSLCSAEPKLNIDLGYVTAEREHHECCHHMAVEQLLTSYGCLVVEGVEGKATAPTTTALCSAPAGDLPNQTSWATCCSCWPHPMILPTMLKREGFWHKMSLAHLNVNDKLWWRDSRHIRCSCGAKRWVWSSQCAAGVTQSPVQHVGPKELESWSHLEQWLLLVVSALPLSATFAAASATMPATIDVSILGAVSTTVLTVSLVFATVVVTVTVSTKVALAGLEIKCASTFFFCSWINCADTVLIGLVLVSNEELWMLVWHFIFLATACCFVLACLALFEMRHDWLCAEHAFF